MHTNAHYHYAHANMKENPLCLLRQVICPWQIKTLEMLLTKAIAKMIAYWQDVNRTCLPRTFSRLPPPLYMHFCLSLHSSIQLVIYLSMHKPPSQNIIKALLLSASLQSSLPLFICRCPNVSTTSGSIVGSVQIWDCRISTSHCVE